MGTVPAFKRFKSFILRKPEIAENDFSVFERFNIKAVCGNGIGELLRKARIFKILARQLPHHLLNLKCVRIENLAFGNAGEQNLFKKENHTDAQNNNAKNCAENHFKIR